MNTIINQGLMPVLGKDQLEIEDLESTLTQKSKVFVDAGISVIEGTCRADNYRDVAEILAKAQKEIPGMIGAMGTQSNIISMHYCIEKGIPVIVAADKFEPMPMGTFAIPSMQGGHNLRHRPNIVRGSDAYNFMEYVREHIKEFADVLGYSKMEKEIIKDNPLRMDPVAYCFARNVVHFPAWFSRSELGNLLMRGARTVKGFNFSERSPANWDAYTKAVSDDYAAEITGMMGTGGLSITEVKGWEGGKPVRRIRNRLLSEKQNALYNSGNLIFFQYEDKLYADTVVPCLKANKFIAAGSGHLGKGSVDEVKEKATLYVCRAQHRDAA